MTRHPEHDPRDKAVTQRLNQHQDCLTDALDAVLDAETGLHEILLQSRHDTAADGLDTVLDTEAGLAAILPPVPRLPVLLPVSQPETPEACTAEDRVPHSVSPAERIALRSHPDVAKATRVFTRDNGYAQKIDLERADDDDRNLALVLALILARDLARKLAQDLDQVLKHAAVSDLTSAHSQALALARSLARAIQEARNEELSALTLSGLTFERPFHLDRDSIRAQERNGDSALTLRLGHVRSVDRDLDVVLSFIRDQQRGPDLALIRDVFRIRTHQIRWAVEGVLGRRMPELGTDAVHAFLDDFTTADLRTADLADADLTGVSWSEIGTQWPSTMDVASLKARSVQTSPTSGIWIVQSGTATVRDFAEL